MTPREEFAKAAMTGLLAWQFGYDSEYDNCAKVAVKHADALLAALAEPAAGEQGSDDVQLRWFRKFINETDNHCRTSEREDDCRTLRRLHDHFVDIANQRDAAKSELAEKVAEVERLRDYMQRMYDCAWNAQQSHAARLTQNCISACLHVYDEYTEALAQSPAGP